MVTTAQYIRVADPQPGQEIIYASKCSFGTGVTLLVLGCLLLVAGIVELCIPPFVTSGLIFGVAWCSVMAGAVGVVSGQRVNSLTIRASLICSTIAAVWNGLWVPGMIARIIMVLIVLPLAYGEGPNYEYIFNHTYNADGSIDEMDYDPERIPITYPGDDMDVTATATLFVLELMIVLAACIICIVQSALACSTMCGGVKVKAQAMVQMADGSLAPATVVNVPDDTK